MKISVQSLFDDYEENTVELNREADTRRILDKTMEKLPKRGKKRTLRIVLAAAAAIAVLCGAAAITHYAAISQEEKSYTLTIPTQTPAGHLVEKEYVIHNDNSIRFDTQGKMDGYYCGLQLGWLPDAKTSILGTLGDLLQSCGEDTYAALSTEDVQQATSLFHRGDFWFAQDNESCSISCLSANWVAGVDLLMAGDDGTIVKEGMINGLSATWVDCTIPSKNPDTLEVEPLTTTHYLLLYDPDKLCVVVLWGDDISICEKIAENLTIVQTDIPTPAPSRDFLWIGGVG
mgnify:FL=1